MKSYKHLFSRALAVAPGRLHFAAHSHHLWPDASCDGHLAAWEDAAVLADRKWEKIFGEVMRKLPGAQAIPVPSLDLGNPEVQVVTDRLRAAEAGLSNREIAKLLFIEPSTVKVHAHRIYDKLGVRSRTALAVQAAATTRIRGSFSCSWTLPWAMRARDRSLSTGLATGF